MGKTLRRFQRSGSKVQRLNLKVSFQCRRVSSHLWPSIKPCQALHVDQQQWQSIARFSLAEFNLLQSYQLSLRSLAMYFVLRTPTNHTGQVPWSKAQLYDRWRLFACYFFNLSQEQKPTPYNKCLDIGREESLSKLEDKKQTPKVFIRVWCVFQNLSLKTSGIHSSQPT